MSEYRVTFGQQYPRETHPMWSWANKDGWLTVVAPDEDSARELVWSFLGNRWSSLEEASDCAHWGMYPLGELARIEVARKQELASAVPCTCDGPAHLDDGWNSQGLT